MGLSWKELEPIFQKVVPRFVSKRHDYWEIVAEVWLMGRIQPLKDPKMVKRRIYLDCIDYLRRVDGRIMANKKTSPKKRMYTKSLDRPIGNDPHQRTLMDFFGREDPEKVEEQDEMAFLVKGLNRRQRLVVKMCAEGFLHKEIAPIIGITESSVSLIHKAARQIIIERLKRLSPTAPRITSLEPLINGIDLI